MGDPERQEYLIFLDSQYLAHKQQCLVDSEHISSSLTPFVDLDDADTIDTIPAVRSSWRHIHRKENVSGAWDEVLRQGSFQQTVMLPPNELRRSYSTGEDLFIWSTGIGLDIFSPTLRELTLRYGRGHPHYLSVVAVQDALEYLFLEMSCNPAPHLVSIDKELRDTLEQHVKELGECMIRRYQITMEPESRAEYVAVTLSSLIGQRCSHIKFDPPCRLQSIEQRNKEIFITLQARVEELNTTLFLKATLELENSSSLKTVGIEFLTGCGVLKKLDDMLESVNGESVKGESVNGESVKGESVKRESVKRESVEGEGESENEEGAKGESVKGESVKGESMKGEGESKNEEREEGKEERERA
jgi:hypothetical protein